VAQRLFAVVNVLLCAGFVAAALLQHNDPDPVRWMVVYSLAAAACLWPRRAPGHRILTALLGVAALAWAASLVPAVVRELPAADLVDALAGPRAMESPLFEQTRETGGLLLVALWMAALHTRSLLAAER
jgi:hypothetical protein